MDDVAASPQLDPALRRLGRFVGNRAMEGHLVRSISVSHPLDVTPRAGRVTTAQSRSDVPIPTPARTVDVPYDLSARRVA